MAKSVEIYVKLNRNLSPLIARYMRSLEWVSDNLSYFISKETEAYAREHSSLLNNLSHTLGHHS
jgi:hypothetical protein